MKKIIVVLIFLINLVACQKGLHKDFVYINDNVFKIYGEQYFPVMINYVVDLRVIDSILYVVPDLSYDSITKHESNTEEEILQQFRAHFQIIKEMGFNSIRLCFTKLYKVTNGYYSANNQTYSTLEHYEDIFASLQKVTDIAKEYNLRILLLTPAPMDDTLENYTCQLFNYFRNEPYIFAYDLFNEPLYFDSTDFRDKTEVVRIVKKWKKMMNKYAPRQLLTIGFAEPIEVFRWDASILPIDFVEIHTYKVLRTKAEIYWYHKYINKPFMIGETALPADNKVISYRDQRNFMREIFQYARDCGAIGFGWWEYQERWWKDDDDDENSLQHRFSALINHEGITYTSDSQYHIYGTIKPAALEIQHFADYQPQMPQMPMNFYNVVGFSNICIEGVVYDNKKQKPIEGAVIRGWNNDWSIGMNTYTDPDGKFTLYCNQPCTHFFISAPGRELKRIHLQLDYRQVVDDQYDINHLPDADLDSDETLYQRYLSPDDSISVFNWDKKLFHKKIFIGNLDTIYLKKLK